MESTAYSEVISPPEAKPEPVRSFAKGATTRHTGTTHLGIRVHGRKNVKNRFRITVGTAKHLSNGSLIDILENSMSQLRDHERKRIDLPPSKLQWHRRVHGIVRTELLKRGFDAEALDYDPEEHADDRTSSTVSTEL